MTVPRALSFLVAALSVPGVLQAGVDPDLSSDAATRIVVFDLRPHGDHVHVGAFLEIPVKYGAVRDPVFLGHDTLAFRASGEPGPGDVGRMIAYDLWDGEELGSVPIEGEWRDPRVIPGSPGAISVVAPDGDGQAGGRVVRLEFHASCPGGCPAPVPFARSGVVEHAWNSEGLLVMLVEEEDPGSGACADPDATRSVFTGREGGGQPTAVVCTASSPLHGIPGSEEFSFVREGADGRRHLVRVLPSSGTVTSSRPLPAGAEHMAWYSPFTAFLVYEGGLYRSTEQPEFPWVRVLDSLEIGAPILGLAVSPYGLRVALVLAAEGS